MEATMYSIYQLLDPRSQQPCYIGITRDLKTRWEQHVRGGEGTNAAKDAWIEELRRQGLTPIIKEVEQATSDKQARERERVWIHHLIGQGIPLLNISRTAELVERVKLGWPIRCDLIKQCKKIAVDEEKHDYEVLEALLEEGLELRRLRQQRS
jgi:predicted GIY-YIG superfamily endonuclease